MISDMQAPSAMYCNSCLGLYTKEKQESPANAKGTRDSSACIKAHCEQM